MTDKQNISMLWAFFGYAYASWSRKSKQICFVLDSGSFRHLLACQSVTMHRIAPRFSAMTLWSIGIALGLAIESRISSCTETYLKQDSKSCEIDFEVA